VGGLWGWVGDEPWLWSRRAADWSASMMGLWKVGEVVGCFVEACCDGCRWFSRKSRGYSKLLGVDVLLCVRRMRQMLIKIWHGKVLNAQNSMTTCKAERSFTTL
jgi:hypothetical protein